MSSFLHRPSSGSIEFVDASQAEPEDLIAPHPFSGRQVHFSTGPRRTFWLQPRCSHYIICSAFHRGGYLLVGYLVVERSVNLPLLPIRAAVLREQSILSLSDGHVTNSLEN